MKINHIIKSTVLASCLVLLSNCTLYDMGYNSGEYASEYQYRSARYDNEGYPIFGYQGGRPIYAYSNIGAPIFSITLISHHCHVPSWRPAAHYHGHYHHSTHVHYHRSVPSCANRYREQHYPKINKPHRPDHNSHGERDKSYNHKSNSTPVYNRPSSGGNHNAGRPNRPSSGGSHNVGRPNKPSSGGNHNAGRPNRPSSGGSHNVSRPSRPSSGGSHASRPSRPSSSASRPSRPSSRPSR